MSIIERLLAIIFLYILKRAVYHEELFGTKTSYFSLANMDDSELEVEGCSPEMIWLFARHGTRTPAVAIIDNITEKLPRLRDEIVTAWQKGRGNMKEKDIIKMINWSFNITADDFYQLVP